MKECILEMKGITKRFPGVIALKDISMSVYKGEILAICGENGAGKSTLMKILSGSYTNKEYEGDIYVDGSLVEFTSVSVSQKCGIEMVYQEQNVMLDASIAENIFVGNLPLKGGFVDYPKLYSQTQKLLNEIGLNYSPKMKARVLNSGQLQLISVIRAMSKKPRVMVLDEPTTALTDAEVELLFQLLHRLRQKGLSFVFITHKIEEIYRMADRVLVMRDGELVATHDSLNIERNILIEELVGRKIQNMYHKEHNAEHKEVLRVEELYVPHPFIKGKNIIDGVSFSLYKGEVLGIGGLVGAGRSELLGAIFGEITNNVRKKVWINNEEAFISSPKDAIAYGIGYVTEERRKSGYVWCMTIRENISLASLKDLPGKYFINRGIERQQTRAIFDRLRIKAPSLETVVVNLSGGNQQKVVLGKWLLKKPEILFIDEPTKGIDVGAKAEIYQIINELTRSGISIIMVSSDMPELISMSDRCLVLNNGKFTEELTGNNITQEKVMEAMLKEA
ncbi:MAG: sugar ABC transporter ATP-binding protein [Clostridiales bacterium]|nr:sugar ABC transporter ATP-binding protein [Clostridiales bacterium]